MIHAFIHPTKKIHFERSEMLAPGEELKNQVVYPERFRIRRWIRKRFQTGRTMTQPRVESGTNTKHDFSVVSCACSFTHLNGQRYFAAAAAMCNGSLRQSKVRHMLNSSTAARLEVLSANISLRQSAALCSGKVRTCSSKPVPLQRQFYVNSGNIPLFCGKVAGTREDRRKQSASCFNAAVRNKCPAGMNNDGLQRQWAKQVRDQIGGVELFRYRGKAAAVWSKDTQCTAWSVRKLEQASARYRKYGSKLELPNGACRNLNDAKRFITEQDIACNIAWYQVDSYMPSRFFPTQQRRGNRHTFDDYFWYISLLGANGAKPPSQQYCERTVLLSNPVVPKPKI
ncbi:hypothetical protein C8R45DRAFT_940553 [Mycena sanguinolenta]|nr:hypothetical protein C8R45DRAFT_940553 [Mycena sanguinolenta]